MSGLQLQIRTTNDSPAVAHLCKVTHGRFVYHSVLRLATLLIEVLDYGSDWESRQLDLAPSPPLFTFYPNIILLGSVFHHNHIWRIEINESLVLVGISSVAVTMDNVLLYKTSNLRIQFNLYCVLPRPNKGEFTALVPKK